MVVKIFLHTTLHSYTALGNASWKLSIPFNKTKLGLTIKGFFHERTNIELQSA